MITYQVFNLFDYDSSKFVKDVEHQQFVYGSTTDSTQTPSTRKACQLHARPLFSVHSFISMEGPPPRMLTLIYRGKTHKVPLEGTQSNLQLLIQSATEVPPAEQTILCKGRKLVIAPDAPVEDLNLDRKAMLLRKPAARKQTPVSPAIAPLRLAEKRLIQFEEKLKTIRESINRHTKGFLDKDMTNEALDSDRKETCVVEEGVMRLVEEVDGMPVPDQDADIWRAERGSIIRKAQGLLVVADGLHEKVRELREDRWGEVASRRGRK